jgi:hypothetical protein
MAMQFFINPKNLDRLYPWGEDGDGKQYWIEVKRHLSARESQDIRAAGIPHIMQKPGDPKLSAAEQEKLAQTREVKMGLDMGRMALVRATKYIVRWSLPDDEGKTMPLSEATSSTPSTRRWTRTRNGRRRRRRRTLWLARLRRSRPKNLQVHGLVLGAIRRHARMDCRRPGRTDAGRCRQARG